MNLWQKVRGNTRRNANWRKRETHQKTRKQADEIYEEMYSGENKGFRTRGGGFITKANSKQPRLHKGPQVEFKMELPMIGVRELNAISRNSVT